MRIAEGSQPMSLGIRIESSIVMGEFHVGFSLLRTYN